MNASGIAVAAQPEVDAPVAPATEEVADCDDEGGVTAAPAPETAAVELGVDTAGELVFADEHDATASTETATAAAKTVLDRIILPTGTRPHVGIRQALLDVNLAHC